jgi:uncharacterized membrane protein YphA (DoxX/SURF4 family)
MAGTFSVAVEGKMNNPENKITSVWWALRIGLGAAAFLAGLDKFFNLLANWEAYLSPVMARMLPVSDVTFMHAVGVIEMVVGLAILTRWTRVGSYVAMVWLTAIALNLVTTGRFFDVAVRDLEMAIAAFALGRLTELRHPVAERERSMSLPDVHGFKAKA